MKATFDGQSASRLLVEIDENRARSLRSKGGQLFAKKIIDVAGAVILLCGLCPLLAIIAGAVWCSSPGPILYRQTRLMKGGKSFELLKFRTMYLGSDVAQHGILHLNHASGPLFKVSNDPRVTPIGRFLRGSFMDELPQLINVLRGEMSLVGPRPCLMSEADEMSHHAAFRFLVPQGMTGPWQTGGQHRLSFEAQLDLEREYVDNWSIRADLRILYQTLRLVLCFHGI
ncbi:MAG: sugar transferase [Candidatus Dormibacteria bacterium]